MNDLMVGQPVYYWPEASECGPYPKGQPLLALVAHIVSLPTPDAGPVVNLSVLGMEGDWHKAKAVPLVLPGQPTPCTEKGALRRHATLWGAHDDVAVADLGESPDVRPGPGGEQDPKQQPKTDDEPKSLLGSSKLDAVIPVNGKEYQLGSVVVAAWKRSDLTPAAWNDLADDKREALLDAELVAIAKGESIAEPIPVPVIDNAGQV